MLPIATGNRPPNIPSVGTGIGPPVWLASRLGEAAPPAPAGPFRSIGTAGPFTPRATGWPAAGRRDTRVCTPWTGRGGARAAGADRDVGRVCGRALGARDGAAEAGRAAEARGGVVVLGAGRATT